MNETDVTADDVLNILEGLPKDHYHCPALASETMKKLVNMYDSILKLSQEEHDQYARSLVRVLSTLNEFMYVELGFHKKYTT